IVGRAIVINGAPAEIVGVSPRGFAGANVGSTADLTLTVATLPAISPYAAGLLGAGNSWLRVLARPQPGVTSGEAEARLEAAWPQIAPQAINPAWSRRARRRSRGRGRGPHPAARDGPTCATSMSSRCRS